MATAFKGPEEIEAPGMGDWTVYEKQCDEYKQKLREWCKKHTDSKSELVGEIYRHGVADGYAQYMVFRTRPLQLIHLETGDAWYLPDVHIRGLRLQDIKKHVEGAREIRKLFSKKEEAA